VKAPSERTREVTLDPETTADTPARNQGPGRSLPGPDAGHPLQRAASLARVGGHPLHHAGGHQAESSSSWAEAYSHDPRQLGYFRPEKQTVGDQRQGAVTVANTVAKPLDKMRPVRTAVECRSSTRTATDGLDDVPTPTDQKVGGSSPSERSTEPQVRAFFSGMGGALNPCFGPPVSQFLTALSDLVNLGEGGLAALQVLVARMDVGLLGERRVVMARPLADDRDRHAPRAP
jgi:hypothetical protein